MRNYYRTLLSILTASAIILVISCNKNKTSADKGPERPYQPWVFRSVLDQQPRMITLALHDDLWVAYHTDSCSLYKVWKGHVHLQGAVYDNAHGPQPISIGDSWIENPYKQPWKVSKDGKNVFSSITYKGHVLKEGHAYLMYEIVCDDGTMFTVHEQPEVLENPDGQMGFERKFNIQNAPSGYEVSIAQKVSSIALNRNIETNGKWEVDNETKSEFEKKQLLTLDGYLTLKNDGETFFKTYFINSPSIDNPTKLETDDVGMSLGERLIAKNDCKTCHNAKVQTIGPAYIHIAEKYPLNNETVTLLTNKIIKGGGGIWGTQVMSAHAELPVPDANEMVRYILSLDTLDAGQKEGKGETPLALVSQIIEGKDMLPGLLVEGYTNQMNLEKLPTYPSTKKSDQAGIVRDFYGMDALDFGGLKEDFVLKATGYLYAEKDTTAGLRIWSDDGSRVTLDGQVILDNDGMHGTEVKETLVRLSKGYHPITIDYIQGKGGRYLSFEWKPDGMEEWTNPLDVLFHSTELHSKLQGKSLAMSMGNRIPGDQSSLVSVHPSYDLSQARPWDFLPKVGGMDFMSDGRMAISTWDPSGSVYLLTNVSSGNPAEIKVKQIATGLAEPLGLKVVNDTIYVMQKQELTRLVDTNGDDIIDEYQCINNSWQTSANFHEFGFGLAEREGDLFATLAIAIQPGGASGLNQMPSRGHAVRFDMPSGKLHLIANGLRTPNGIGIGIDNEIFVADNQGDWLPSSKIIHVTQGDFFGSRAVDFAGTATSIEKPPVVWLPQDEIGNSPTTPLAIHDGPYKGQMMHGEVTHGGIKRVFVEKINGAYQGVVFRFIQGLEAGVNRMVWGPDGGLYVGGIGNSGNWSQTDKLWYGLQRLKYNSKSTFEMLAIRAKSDGVEIEFTEPLREGDGWEIKDWEVRQWRYIPTAAYGGPKIDDVALKVMGAYVSADRNKVSLRLNGMKAGHVVYVHMKNPYVSDSGNSLWSTEGWYTMNNVPSNNSIESTAVPTFSPNSLTTAEANAGWKLLFDGKTTAGWHNFNKTTIGSSWIVSEGALTLDAKRNPDGHWQAADGGDIIADGEYENFEFNAEWKISPCGNSGIIYNVVESSKHEYVWQTGPEMQVLDDVCHPDTRYPTHRAGDLYDLIACSYVTVRPAGEWNKVRIIKSNGKVEHWLNGIKVVSYEMYTDKWIEMINASKFKEMPDFGRAKKGKIALQDHGDKVWYRNIKVKPL